MKKQFYESATLVIATAQLLAALIAIAIDVPERVPPLDPEDGKGYQVDELSPVENVRPDTLMCLTMAESLADKTKESNLSV